MFCNRYWLKMGYKNRYGLSRYIREDIKQTVRQRDLFGCVICGSIFFKYAHLNGGFAEAESHDPKDIVLLCANHHDDLDIHYTLSEEEVRCQAKERAALKLSRIRGHYRMIKPVLHVGSNKAVNCYHFIAIQGKSILSISQPEQRGGPFRLNADFQNSRGEQTVKIVNNEWEFRADNWDIRRSGARIYVYSAKRKIDLVMRPKAPNDFFIKKLDMEMNGYKLLCDGDSVSVHTPDGRHLQYIGTYAERCGMALINIDPPSTGSGLPLKQTP